MKNYLKLAFGVIFNLTLLGCLENNDRSVKMNDDGWVKKTKVSKLIKNVNFVFPESGFAFDNKEDLIKQTFDAIEQNKNILQKVEFKDTIYVRFMASRDEMFEYTGTRAGGNAYPYWSTINIVSNEDETHPPINHELMHLMAMMDWDYAESSSVWINEGIATYAANDCNGYSVAEIYRYLLVEDKLISIEDLSSDFYGQSEMVSYHQLGYIVQYLLDNFSIRQFEQLWTDGFENFETIYGIPYQQVETNLQKAVIEKYPNTPKIDWEKFSKGCK